MANENIQITWQAPEFKHYPKNAAWYTTLIIIAVLLIGYEIVQKDIFAAIIMFLLSVFVWTFSKQIPKQVTITLTIKGVHLNDYHIPYKGIKHFWIVNNENHKTLNLETTTYLNRTMIIQLEDQDPEYIRKFLNQHLPEHPREHETFAQKVIHRLKF